MDGAAVKEMGERFATPQQVKEFIVSPQGWSLTDLGAAVKPGPQAEPLAVYTLGALRDYVKANRDDLDLAKTVVHVMSPQVVRLSGPLQARARNRESYVQASAFNLTEQFLGKYMSVEEFIIGLQSRFVNAGDRAAVLRLFGTVKSETVKTASDDGITQVVETRAGAVLKSEAPVPNPVMLMPFRTFREVEQPASAFVLRVSSGPIGGLPQVGLFEADGGAWKLVAVEHVREWLAAALPSEVAVLA